jgi:Na+/melibiose symporter-like transporter
MEFIFAVVVMAVTIIPMFKLLPSYGINPYWSLVCITALGLIVLLWIMASRVDERRP